MAAIDKTYCKNYTEYSQLKEWAKGKVINFWNGSKLIISDYIYEWEESDFNGRDLPIMNTPECLDIYLIQNCPVKFVQDRMKYVWGEEYSDKKNIEFPTVRPTDLKQNRKIIISQTGNLPLKNKGLYSHRGWRLQSINSGMSFDTETKKWVRDQDNLPHNTNTSHHKTIKELIRFLRNQYLPSGAEFRLIGRFVGEKFLVTIK